MLLLGTGLQAAPRNGTSFFASLYHLVQPLFVRSSCHRLSGFLIGMTRNMVFIRYFYVHGPACIRSEAGLCSLPGFVIDGQSAFFAETGILPVCHNIEMIPVFSISFSLFLPLPLSSSWKVSN